MNQLSPGAAANLATLDRATALGALVEFGVAIPMRDGIVLRADVIRPAGDRPAPVILMRNPYGPIVARANLDPLRAVAEGFAVVMQSVRGTGASDGAFIPWAQEETDGYDSVAWCAAQPWSSGRVATYGPSYLGQAQLYAAAARHPAHVAMVPYVTPSHPYEVTYEDGALLLGSTFGWAFARAGEAIGRGRSTGPDADLDAGWRAWLAMGADIDDVLETVPLRDIPLVGRRFPDWNDWLAHPERDAWWRRVDLGGRGRPGQQPAEVVIAARRLDIEQQHVAADPEVRADQRLHHAAGLHLVVVLADDPLFRADIQRAEDGGEGGRE